MLIANPSDPKIFPELKVLFKFFCQLLQQGDFSSNEKTPIFICGANASFLAFSEPILELTMIKQQKYLRIIKTISYSDHYEYSQADMEKIKREVQLNDIDIIVTTEKDMVKIEKLKLSNLEIFSLAGDFQIVEKNKFFVQLDKKLLNQS